MKPFWDRIGKPAVSIVQALGLLLTGVGLVLTSCQLQFNHRVESADLGLKFDERLSKPEAIKIIDAAEEVPAAPILVEHHGKVTDDELEAVLGDYDTLYYLRQEGLINDQMTYDLFCLDLETVHSNKEVAAYLAQERKEARQPDLYVGFDLTAEACQLLDKNGRGHKLAR